MLKKYNETFNVNKTLLPSVFSLLKAVPEDYLYFKKYSALRHPGAILVRSTEEIVVSMNKVLKYYYQTISKLKIDDKAVNQQDVLLELQTLVGHFDSFQDEAYLVLKGLCSPPDEDNCPEEKFVHRWLKGNGFTCGDNFLGRSKNIQKYIDIFSNGLKHGNRRFDFVFAQAGGYSIPGVFIDELKGAQVKESYPWLSGKILKSTIAFSFNYLLQALLLCFYVICDDLGNSIKVHLKETKNFKFGKIEKEKHSDSFEEMVLGIAMLPKVFYPYEHKKSPKVIKKGNEVIIRYPHGDKVPYNTGQFKSYCVQKGDGYTRDFTLPAFG